MMLMTPAALMLALFNFAGCSGSGKGASEDLGPVDYSLAERWLSRPDITKEADVFYLYPTLYNGSETEPDYAAIDNREMLEAAELIYDGQASVFQESANIFAPYYRQTSLEHEAEVYRETGSLDDAFKGLPLQDAEAALDYYFENLNEGRPFILAGHSQGAAILKELLKTYFRDHPEYYQRMVAAYIVGYSVTQKDLDDSPQLRFASGETDTGVIISWNTEGRQNAESNAANMVVLPGSIAINPLNWRRDDTYAPASENLGSYLWNVFSGTNEVMDIGADAQVNLERGTVISSPFAAPVMVYTEYFGPESYHTGDYSLFYVNIRENAARRIAAYLEEGEGS